MSFPQTGQEYKDPFATTDPIKLAPQWGHWIGISGTSGEEDGPAVAFSGTKEANKTPQFEQNFPVPETGVPQFGQKFILSVQKSCIIRSKHLETVK